MWGDRVVFAVDNCDTWCDNGVMQIDQFKAFNSVNKITETTLVEEPPTDTSSINFSTTSDLNPRSTYVSNDGANWGNCSLYSAQSSGSGENRFVFELAEEMPIMYVHAVGQPFDGSVVTDGTNDYTSDSNCDGTANAMNYGNNYFYGVEILIAS